MKNRDRWSLVFGLAAAGLNYTTAHAETIAQVPLFISTAADPNVLINLSVETPMGGAAYADQSGNPPGCVGRINNVLGDTAADNVGSCYFAATEYLGYFDAKKCYAFDSASSRFNPIATTTNDYSDQSCAGYWSGNFLNWAALTAIDEFIFAMTGGNRITDTTADTVIRRARVTESWYPVKVVNASLNVAPSSVTPYSNGTLFIRNHNGFGMRIGTTYANVMGTGVPDVAAISEVNLAVCDAASGIESNCTPYKTGTGATYYKPEGLIQKDSGSKRFALTSYLVDSSAGRQGGVLRSKMKYVGPRKPDGAGALVDNPAKEFGADGLLISNPDGATGGLNSGVINYINKFSDAGYKSYDPVSELFYESLRYFRNLGPTPENYAGVSRSSADTKSGGFWFYQAGEWDDPIQFSCQKNTVVAINDAYPWLDKRLPGTAFTSRFIVNSIGANYDLDSPAGGGSSDWGQPSNPDPAIDVKSQTDQVGTMEDGQVYHAGKPEAYTFDLGSFPVGGGNGTWTGTCSAKNVSSSGLGSVMATCSKAAASAAGAGRDNTYYVAGLAWYGNTTDLRGDIAGTQNVSTYMIDSQEYQSTPNVGPSNPLWLAGKYGGFKDSNGDKNPNVGAGGAASNEWDENGDGEPDNYVLASQPKGMIEALRRSFADISQSTQGAASVVANATRMGADVLVYQAQFDSSDWKGNFLAFPIDQNSGNIIDANSDAVIDAADANWQAADEIPQWDLRKIVYYDPVAKSGKDFTTANVTASFPALGFTADLVEYLRGRQTKEKQNGGTFRDRSKRLGDIVNADSSFVGTQDYGYDGLLGSEAASYQAFRGSAGYRNRRRAIYVGANDGMLHGFDAGKNAGAYSTGGDELLAFVPNAVVPNLANLALAGYDSKHLYFVDGAARSVDAYLDTDGNGSGDAWRTILVGTTAGGGRGVFALNVTDPASFAANKVLWDISPTVAPTSTDLMDDLTATPKRHGFASYLGYTFAQPSIARMHNGKWAVILGNGYESPAQTAVLLIIDASSGALIRSISTERGSASNANGLSTAVPLDSDGDRIVDVIYAGDLLGNLWKFDVSSTNSGDWEVAYGTAGVPQPLFSAKDASGNAQPVTAKITLGRPGDDQSGGVMLYFGTGKYIVNSDKLSTQIQSIYGIWDSGAEVTGRGQLVQQIVTQDVSSGSREVRVTSSNPVNYGTKKGWYLDLKPSSGAPKGERVLSAPMLFDGRILFGSFEPQLGACETGGSTWLILLDPLSGGRITDSGGTWDIAGSGSGPDGTVDSADLVTVGGGSYSPSGLKVNDSINRNLAVIVSGGNADAFTNRGSARFNLGLNRGRQSWRQLQ